MANQCTNSEVFYNKLEEVKANAKTKSSLVEVYIEDSFYQKAYQWLKAKAEGESDSIAIVRKDKRRIIAKKWSDYRRWKNTRRTKQICGPEERTVHNPQQFAFSNSSQRARQDRGICKKALFRHNTEGHKLVHIDV